MKYYEEIRRRRQELLMSQRDLAAKSGITGATISSIERGVAMPSTRTLEQIAQALCGEYRTEFVWDEIKRPEDEE